MARSGHSFSGVFERIWEQMWPNGGMSSTFIRSIYTADIPGRYRLCPWGGCILLPEAGKEASISLPDSPSTKHIKRQLVWRHDSFVPRFVIEWRDLWPKDFLKQLAFLLLHDLTRPLDDLDRYPWKRKTWEIQHEQRTWAGWWLNKRLL